MIDELSKFGENVGESAGFGQKFGENVGKKSGNGGNVGENP